MCGLRQVQVSSYEAVTDDVVVRELWGLVVETVDQRTESASIRVARSCCFGQGGGHRRLWPPRLIYGESSGVLKYTATYHSSSGMQSWFESCSGL